MVVLPSTEPGFCPASVVPGPYVGPDLGVRLVIAANASGEDMARKDKEQSSTMLVIRSSGGGVWDQ